VCQKERAKSNQLAKKIANFVADIEFQLHTHMTYTKLRVYITETSLVIKYDRLKTESAKRTEPER
jgi:hypothetical protein